MAARFPLPRLPLLATFLSASVALLAGPGCQQPTVVSALPEPNFNGPQIAPQVVAVAPRAEPKFVEPKRPVAGRLTGPKDWTPGAPARSWRWIVIHHSATPGGNAAMFAKMHRDKGWDELGYHFVIGNGTDSPDGAVEIGSRWPKQKWGAHAKTADNKFNDYGIGICLVGNFDVDRPTAAQQQALAKLTAWLMKNYRISPDRVMGHGDTKATECPGRYINIAQIRRMASQTLVDAGELVEPDGSPDGFPSDAIAAGNENEPIAAGAELLSPGGGE